MGSRKSCTGALEFDDDRRKGQAFGGRECEQRHRDKLSGSRCNPSPGGGRGTWSLVSLVAEWPSVAARERVLKGAVAPEVWRAACFRPTPPRLDSVFAGGASWGAAGSRVLITPAFTAARGQKGTPAKARAPEGQCEKLSPGPGEVETALAPSPCRPGSLAPQRPALTPARSAPPKTLSPFPPHPAFQSPPKRQGIKCAKVGVVCPLACDQVQGGGVQPLRLLLSFAGLYGPSSGRRAGGGGQALTFVTKYLRLSCTVGWCLLMTSMMTHGEITPTTVCRKTFFFNHRPGGFLYPQRPFRHVCQDG